MLQSDDPARADRAHSSSIPREAEDRRAHQDRPAAADDPAPSSPPGALLEAALPPFEDAVRFVCRRKRTDAEESDEFASFARLKLLEGDCGILRAFGGRSELRTYLGVVVQRLFIDFRRQRWGCWRPSADARRLGPAGVLLDTLISRDGIELEHAIETLATNKRLGLSRDELRAMGERLPRRSRRRMEGEESLAELAVSAAHVEAPALAAERGNRAKNTRGALRALLAGLSDEESTVLRLRFQDGLTVARIAQLLQLSAKPLYVRLERLLARLRSGLESSGLSASEVTDLIECGAFDEEDR